MFVNIESLLWRGFCQIESNACIYSNKLKPAKSDLVVDFIKSLWFNLRFSIKCFANSLNDYEK